MVAGVSETRSPLLSVRDPKERTKKKKPARKLSLFDPWNFPPKKPKKAPPSVKYIINGGMDLMLGGNLSTPRSLHPSGFTSLYIGGDIGVGKYFTLGMRLRGGLAIWLSELTMKSDGRFTYDNICSFMSNLTLRAGIIVNPGDKRARVKLGLAGGPGFVFLDKYQTIKTGLTRAEAMEARAEEVETKLLSTFQGEGFAQINYIMSPQFGLVFGFNLAITTMSEEGPTLLQGGVNFGISYSI